MNKILLIISLLFNPFFLAAQNSFVPKYQVVLDSSKGLLMTKQCSREHPENVASFWNISTDDVGLLNKNFKKILSMRIHDGFGNTKIYDLSNFVYQYVGLILNGEKYIYINASAGFPGGDIESWKRNPVVVCDGGPGFWGILFNLNKLEFSQLAFDGNL